MTPGSAPAATFGTPKAHRVSQRKELAVVTLGMVAAISSVGGLLAANPPSWATADEPAAATAQQTTAQQQAGRQTAERGEIRRRPPDKKRRRAKQRRARRPRARSPSRRR